MSVNMEVFSWIVIIFASFATAIGVIDLHFRTRQQCRRVKAPRVTPTTTKPMVEITVEFGQVPPGPGILLIAAYQALAGDNKKYKLAYATRTIQSKTFYFMEA